MIMKIKTKKCYLIYFCAIFFMKNTKQKLYYKWNTHTKKWKKFNFKIKKMQQKNSLLNKKKFAKNYKFVVFFIIINSAHFSFQIKMFFVFSVLFSEVREKLL